MSMECRVVICDVNESLVVKVLCSVVMLEQGVEHPQLQLSYRKGRVV